MNCREYYHPYSLIKTIDTQFFTTWEAVDQIEKKDAELGNEPKKEYEADLTILQGNIHWVLSDSEKYSNLVPQWMIFCAADDAAGQLNKLLFKTVQPDKHLSKFGVTGSLEVFFEEAIAANTTSSVEVKITKRANLSQADQDGQVRLKTFCNVVFTSTANKVQTLAKALFVESRSYHPPMVLKIERQAEENRPIEVKRLKSYPTMEYSVENIVSIEDIPQRAENSAIMRTVTWHEGQGPKNCVHGGVMSKPIIQMVKDVFAKKVKGIKINYKSSIPLQTTSTIEITRELKSENEVAFHCFKINSENKKVIEFEGQAIME